MFFCFLHRQPKTLSVAHVPLKLSSSVIPSVIKLTSHDNYTKALFSFMNTQNFIVIRKKKRIPKTFTDLFIRLRVLIQEIIVQFVLNRT